MDADPTNDWQPTLGITRACSHRLSIVGFGHVANKSTVGSANHITIGSADCGTDL
jgi:hypothetical protein